MQVAVLGAGSIGLGTAALLAHNGHAVTLWGRTLPAGPCAIDCTGAVSGRFPVHAAPLDQAVRAAQAVVLTVPGFAHRAVMDAAAPHLRAGQAVVVSSHSSFGALHLVRQVPGLHVAAWGTTVVTGRRTGPLAASVSNVRTRLDVAALPSAWGPEAAALCTALFGDRFTPRDGLVAIALSNLNPQNHLAMALCNLTRIERAEDWGNYWGITPAVGRLMEALDAERLAIAAAYGVQVRTILEHFTSSFAAAPGPVAAMAAEVHGRGNAPLGPKSLDSRYITEDVPFGLVATELLARAARVPAPLHTGGIDLLSAALGRDFRAENDILPTLGLAGLDAAGIRAAVA